MKTNESLQKDVEDAIRWDPLMNGYEIIVFAKDGIVTLAGIVDSYTRKLVAEDIAKNIVGVISVIEKIEIQFNNTDKRKDKEILHEIVNIFKCNRKVLNNKLNVKVEEGWVTLEGEVHWNYQKEAAKKIVGKIVGVKGITSNITIKIDSGEKIEKMDIERALILNCSIDSHHIKVKVSGHRIALRGTVRSLYLKDEAARIAWNAPGVSSIDNDLVINYNQ
jgi:osmotically-inducible protein OsmY